MRQITSLRVCEPGGYSTTYRVGETPAGASAGEFVGKIEVGFVETDSGSEVLMAQVAFANGETLCIPIEAGVSWRLVPDQAEREPGNPESRCEGFVVGPVDLTAACEGDGHYRCQECVSLSSRIEEKS